ncbi:MAG: signal recognition particle-docking protein FtsY [Deltaproteobacteria bacterium]|nr:signal recognition particle-docking protein FtsY [Deltaproteobacteria bacterium]
MWEIAGLLGILFLLLRLKHIKSKKKASNIPPEVQPEPEEPEEPEEAGPDVMPIGIKDRLQTGLSRTRHAFTGRIFALFEENTAIDETTMEEMEEILITSDVGMKTTMALTDTIFKKGKGLSGPGKVYELMKDEIRSFLKPGQIILPDQKPFVIMVVGVNGVGKTTTIGKLATLFSAEGKQVLLGAADTFRSAAAEQLEIWAKRSGAEIVMHRENSDPAAVAFDSVEAGIKRGADVVIIDTAGRLHTKVNLMEELKKIRRSIAKRLSGAPHEVLLVIDATTGQNAISQARQFHDGVGVTSIALTKLDGTAKGGIVIGISNEIGIPISYIGVGEGAKDLQPFDPDAFVDALF